MAAEVPIEDRLAVVVVMLNAPNMEIAQRATADLARDAIVVSLAGAEVFERDPRASVYVVALETALVPLVVDQVAAWATRATRPGVIGLVADGGTRERELLLAAGFDDALVAPISGRELAARVRAVHRRVQWKSRSHGRLRFGAYTLDVDGHALWVDGRVIALTSIELEVIRALVGARGRPLSRVELLDGAWGNAAGELETSERAVDNVILRLRRKLPRPEMIETVRGVGFRLA
ncbi:MAG: response regulator transcription factor [Proteobacteria bacterium]|nr:response regulator transcription factor [Pseudomonadota bacterium]